jgi:hypothetical protein
LVEFHDIVDADKGGEGKEASAGGSNRQDSSRCLSEYHSVQNSGEDGRRDCSLLCGGVGRENPYPGSGMEPAIGSGVTVSHPGNSIEGGREVVETAASVGRERLGV